MAYKNLLVLLDTDQSARERISTVAALAARFDAHLAGLYATVLPECASERDSFALIDFGLVNIPYRQVSEAVREDAELARGLFEDIAARHAVSRGWRFATGYPNDIGIGNALLSCAADLGADLLVMGAYGHSRVRELMLGGATRTVLASMTLPILMSH